MVEIALRVRYDRTWIRYAGLEIDRQRSCARRRTRSKSSQFRAVTRGYVERFGIYGIAVRGNAGNLSDDSNRIAAVLAEIHRADRSWSYTEFGPAGTGICCVC